MASRLDTAARVQKHRAALRAAGLRPVQIWVPDSRKAGFSAECRRQCQVLRKSRAESGTLKWLGDIADTEGWK
ncbi:MAG: antitoxin MazE family protein [Steroidobacteraceae bacterium]